ncbi:MAG: hypothetical protein JW908_11675 [Anaerolineales bacterium]|nr:hypothetical protein [Anaerolineales bacterium]
MEEKKIFDIILLVARPAAGKSEVIDFLKKTPLHERINRFHIGQFEEIDDFPMLWTWFEEDTLLEKMGHPRLHTDQAGYFLGQHFWNLLIERIGLEYEKKQRDNPAYTVTITTMIEFSRGKEHGGYRSAFSHLSPKILDKLAILYIDVSWEESLRKNRKRFNPDRPDSILEHSLPKSKMEHLYKETDWDEISREDPYYLTIKGFRIPYVVLDNSDDVTTTGGEVLGSRLEQVLKALWNLYKKT